MKPKITFFIATAILFISCTKETGDPSSPLSGPTIEQQLCNKIWLMEKITFTELDKLIYYKRNGTNNTVDYYSTDRLIFNEDGTGTYKNFGTNSFEISWSFKDSNKTVIDYTIYNYQGGSPSPGKNLKITMENISIKEDLISYAEIYTKDNNRSTVASVYRKVTKE